MSRRRRRRRWLLLAGVAATLAAAAALVGSGLLGRAIEEFTLPLKHEDIIRQQAREKGVDAALIAAVIYAESRYREQTSDAGARGLMQITPETALDIARRSDAETFVLGDLADPQINISYGTYHLRDLIARYSGNLIAALAAYNAGPGNVDAWGGSDLKLENIRFPETRAYVEDVLEKQGEYRAHYPRELGYR
jgi:peptidoglycan lytic transglycosylase